MPSVRASAGSLERGLVGGGDVLGAAGIVQGGVLGSDGGVVKSGGNGVGEGDLAVVILQDIGIGSLEDARCSAAEACSVLSETRAAATGFDADEADVFIRNELVKGADGVGAAADTGDDGSGQAVFLLEDLRAGSRG